MKMLDHTEHHLVRCYPAGLRIDSSNYNPITMWLGGIQMAALNYQTGDVHMAINNEFFAQYGSCGYVLKPKEMRCSDQVLYKRFPGSQQSNIGAVGTVIFLRFINPAIVSPFEMGIVEKNPPPNIKRGLMLMSKILQKIANHVEFSKEQHMTCFNDFVSRNFDSGRKFFIQIASDCDAPDQVQSHSMSFVSDANVVALHRLLW